MIKRLLAGLGALCAGIGFGAAAYAAEAAKPELVIVADGKSDYAIVVPEGADPGGAVKQASSLLQKTLREATGAELRVMKEVDHQPGTPAIYLGMTQAAQKSPLPIKEISGWTFVNQAVGKDIFLVGQDGPPPKGPGEYLGTLKAVTAFLEDEAGVRFVLPGPNGISIPKLSRLAAPADLNVLRKANFNYVIGRSPGDEAYAVANNFYFMSCRLKSYGGHSYYDAVPAAKYAKDHPEYFALLNGVRNSSQNHLCVSNPDVQKLMIVEMEKWLDAGYDWVELNQTDGYVGCQCEACKAISPDDGERLWIVHRKLAEQMKTLRPDKKVMMTSYGPTSHPPKGFKSFPDNVVMQMCRYDPAAFEEWRPFNVEKTVYIYNWCFGPKRNPRFAEEQVRLFVQNKVRGIYLCGGFECMGLEAPVLYTFGKMMADPKLNAAEVANDFYRAAYGNAVAPMRAFFAGMYDRRDFYCAYDLPNYVINTFSGPEDFYCHFFPARLLADMQNNLDQAKGMDKDPRVQARLRYAEAEFTLTKNLASIFQFYRAYRLAPSWDTFNLLAAEIDKRHAFVDAQYDAQGKMKRADGWPTLWGGAPKAELFSADGMNGTLSAPVNWNTALLREKKVLPGMSKKSLHIARLAAPVTLDGSPDKPAWAGVKPEELNELGMGVLKDGTTFKVAYDDQALYLAFTCEFSKAASTKIVSLGKRDGNSWTAECLEILIDPYGTREKAYHFIFNPVADSRFDERIGFIADPLHPLYGDWDSSWDGEWEYVAKVDVEKKQWTAELRVPYTVLGVPPPQRGTIWTMNIGRESYPTGYGNGVAEYSLWSPNLEAVSIRDVKTFGDLIFE